MYGNLLKARQMLTWLKGIGVKDICICPGGRNAPFVHLLAQQQDFRVVSAFDERAAGFFIFGRSYNQRRPAAVITTSGTAVAELFPSVIEAMYMGAPMIVITADRPRSLRGTGSPQVIDQKNIFGHYVEACLDIDVGEAWSVPQWSQKKPLHINVGFEEPLIDDNDDFSMSCEDVLISSEPSKNASIDWTFLNDPQRVPLLVAGPLHSEEVPSVREFCQKWPGLLYAEGASGLRELTDVPRLRSGEKFLSQLLKNNQLSAVVRVGGVPTLKLWRELEKATVPVMSLSSRSFSGLSRGQLVEQSLVSEMQAPERIKMNVGLLKEMRAHDEKYFKHVQELIAQYPLSEPAWVQRISQWVPSYHNIYLGNSLPIREWDGFASYEQTKHVFVNRGANGIDGQVASALGMTPAGQSLSLVMGDLTLLYDATGLWFQSHVNELHMFVINNNGGRIFERLFANSAFYNSHQVSFAGLAAMWNLSWQKLDVPMDLKKSKRALYEVLPDAQQTSDFWKAYDQLFKSLC
ncbi:MAG: 2-succinyl-5-enolpyruvyl-6-hydroxy-3-cyclohexene-1-carboxylic-acid synthase [Bdellovibrionaceae bacterium]|nr:2-succinyl-5-enolpyruvyl-6-hydroxy-3-cyclohexene-1-carboxylic-acid synthase [Pseudobdellovibrionaceae bacterium]